MTDRYVIDELSMRREPTILLRVYKKPKLQIGSELWNDIMLIKKIFPFDVLCLEVCADTLALT